VADYLAKIKLLVEGVQSLDKVEAKVKEIHRLTAGGWRVDLQSSEGFKKLTKDLDDVAKKGRTAAKALQDSFKNVGTIGKGAGIAGAILAVNQFGAALETASAKAGLFSPAVHAVGSSLKTAIPGVDALVQAFTALPPALQATAPALAAVTAGLIAFNAPIRTAISDTVAVVKALNPVKDAIKTAFSTTLLMAFADTLEMNINAVENYRGSLLRLTDTVGGLSRRKAALQTVLNNTNSSTDTAVKIAGKLVDVTKRLNEEQRAQNDLLREARGLSQSTLEESKAVKSLATKRRREAYLEDVAQGVDAALQAAADLDQELVNLDKHLADLDTAAAERRWQALEQQWKDADAAGAALAARMDEIRSKEAAASLKARGGKEPMPFDTGGVVRRTIAGPAYEKPAGPAGAPFAAERALAAQAESNIRKEFQLRANYEAEIFRIESNFNKEAHFTELEFIQKELEAEIDKIESVGRAQQKADAKALRDFDKRLTTRTEARQKRRQMTENVIIGGAFPMLFGGGPGAVLGGAAGGFIPGNPMLSVATSALGAMVDQFATSTAEMGNALRNPIESFQELAEKGLLASKSQEKYIQKLIEAGRVYEASAIIQDEIIQKIGVQGYKDLQNAGAASEKLNKAFAELSIQMQAAVAGPLAAMLSWLANVIAIGNKTTASAAKQTDILQGLSAQDRAALQQQEQRILSGANIFNEAEKRQQVAQLYQSYSARANVQRPGVTVDSTAAQQAAAQTQQLQAQVDLSAKQLSLVGLTLEKDGERYVNAAKAVALQEYDNKLLEIKNSWIGKVFDAEKNLLMIRGANLAYAAQLRQIDSQVAQQREQNTTALLQAELALYKQAEQNLMFEIKRAQYVDNEKGGAQALLKYYSDIYTQRYNAFLVEREIALKEAERAGTTQDVVRLYQLKLSLLQAEAGLEQAIAKLTQDRLELEKKINAEKAITEARQPFVDFRRNLELQDQYNKTYLRLVTEGMLPAEAERIANFEQLVAQQLLLVEDQIKAINSQIILTEATITEAEARGAAVAKLREELDLLEKRKKAIEGEAQDSGKGEQPGDRIKSAIAAARGELNELVDLENQVIAGAAAIGDAFAQSFKGLVSGAMTGQEALAAFFKNVGDHFMDMASKMIAKLIEIYILETIVGFITGAAGGGASGGPATAPAFAPPAVAAQGAYWPGGFEAFANGGMVTRPTMGLVGEGGEPEYIIPASKMQTAMARYAGGARGESVLSGTSQSQQAPQALDINYNVTDINGMRFVTEEQFTRGMRDAAKMGQAMTFSTLRNAPSVRRKLGV